VCIQLGLVQKNRELFNPRKESEELEASPNMHDWEGRWQGSFKTPQSASRELRRALGCMRGIEEWGDRGIGEIGGI